MSENRPEKEKSLIEKFADESGLAIVVADEISSALIEANNNSMCRVLYSSKEFAPHCDEFCGKAFKKATEAGKPVSYECHAGLNCLAVPFRAKEKELVAIVGRTFLKASNYRTATERAISGDWKHFPPTQLFENVLLTGSEQNLEKTARKIEKLGDQEKAQILETIDEPRAPETLSVLEKPIEKPDIPIEAAIRKPAIKPENNQRAVTQKSQADQISKLVEQFNQTAAQSSVDYEKIARKSREEAEEITAWRSLFGSLLKLDYKQACISVLEFLTRRYELNSMVWLERKDSRLETVLAIGDMKERRIQIGVSAADERLLDAANREVSLELRERKKTGAIEEIQTINLFPIAVGGEVRSALAVADNLVDFYKKKQLARFCQTVASELEILRLREELFQRDWLRKSVNKFNESLKKVDSEDYWLNLTQISAELLRAERASLLIYNEETKVLEAKATVGTTEDLSKRNDVGERIAQAVLTQGKPLIVGEVQEIGLSTAPAARKYRTDSFISFPISIGDRKIAVLNFTDRADEEKFGALDLELLQAIAPQIAVAIDRAYIKDKAGAFQQLSVTDALTGLLNRRYLEERLIEEIKRSNRYGYPMSFMMIDVDDFGKFNKDFGVLIGDEVLRQTVKVMKSNLRGADVAARYGGEEFCILLPQTTLNEAFSIAERIRQSVENIQFPQRVITISIGVATFSYEISTPETIIKASDEALRLAKKKGKNNSQVYGDLENDNYTVENPHENVTRS